MSLKILHISNDYSYRPLYRDLFLNLSSFCSSQTVFAPIKSPDDSGKNKAECSKIRCVYSYTFHKLDRLFFKNKTKKRLHDLVGKIDIKEINIIHAHTMYTDGAVAYELFKRFGIPYVITVRNTDINYFFRFRKDLRGYANQILKYASQVTFLSPSHQRNILSKFRNLPLIEKSNLVPNGIDEKWMKTPLNRKKSSVKRILYVGDFSKNKNTISTVKAVAKISQSNNIMLSLVGPNLERDKELYQLVTGPYNKFIVYHGPIFNQQRLSELFQSHDIFVMPSFFETFGLVYIESLSQGTPVIFSENQGIDGWFDDSRVALRVNPHEVNDIIEKIQSIDVQNTQNAEICRQVAMDFTWDTVAKKYFNIYQTSLESNKWK